MRTSLIALMLLLCCAAAWPMAGQYTNPDSVVQRPEWPSGLLELIKSRAWTHAYWVNADDYFLYCGDTAAFQAFLNAYSKLAAKPLTLILRSGSGGTETFTQQPVRYDWMLAFRQWAPREESQGNPLALELYIGGNVDWAKVKVPANVKVVHGQSCVTADVKYGEQIPLDLVSGAENDVSVLSLSEVRLSRGEETVTASIAA